MAKCVTCGKDITEPYHWESTYEELENNVYCSVECVQTDGVIIGELKHRQFMLKNWRFIKSVLVEAIDLIENNVEDSDFLNMSSEIMDSVYAFGDKIEKDYRLEEK